MLKNSFLVLCISCVLIAAAAHSRDCLQEEQECLKKCKEEKIKSEKGIDIKNAGEDVDDELQAEVLFKLKGLEKKFQECLKACANGQSKCVSN